MTEELQHLWALRALDEQRAEVEEALVQLPVRRKGLDARLIAERARLDRIKRQLVDLQRARHEREQLIQAAADEERKFKSQLNLVKKNEEYTALLHEIEGVRSKRSDLETEVLMRLEEEEQAEKERPAAEKAIADGEREVTARRREFDEEERAATERITSIDVDRTAHLDRLAPATRQRYGRIHGSRAGRAVVGISKDACGGCYRALPPQLLVEARRGERLLSCEGCGRLIIWPPSAA